LVAKTGDCNMATDRWVPLITFRLRRPWLSSLVGMRPSFLGMNLECRRSKICAGISKFALVVAVWKLADWCARATGGHLTR
jgi:hypothetical protein